VAGNTTNTKAVLFSIANMDKPKNKGGRPPKFTSKDQVQTLFEEYFTECAEKKKILTKAGLMVKLDISRDMYADYKAKPEFRNTIRKIEGLIEDAWVQRLTETGATGAIFYLKNAFKEDYRDRNETDITSGGKSLSGVEIKVRK
jgi:hypothetical protein